MPEEKQPSSIEKPETGPRRVRGFFAELGPGLITGAADDDPSGISTYSVTGASFGYATAAVMAVAAVAMFATM